MFFRFIIELNPVEIKMHSLRCRSFNSLLLESCTFSAFLAELSAGSDGQVENSYLQKSDLSRNAKDQYPLVLIKLMTRYGEDLIWANKISDAKAVFNFIDTLTEKRSDANDLRNGKFTLVTFIDPNKSPQIA